MTTSDDPKLTPDVRDGRTYVSSDIRRTTANGGNGNGNSPLPWYSVFRVPLSQLVPLGTLLVSLVIGYYKVQANETEIANLKASAQTKEQAKADKDFVIQRIDLLERNLGQRFDDFRDDLKEARKQQRR